MAPFNPADLYRTNDAQGPKEAAVEAIEEVSSVNEESARSQDQVQEEEEIPKLLRPLEEADEPEP